jgi:hypothetical protein
MAELRCSLTTTWLVALLLLPACSKEPPPAAEQARAPVGASPEVAQPAKPAAEAPAPSAPVVQAAQPAEPAASGAAASQLSEGPFELKLQGAGPFEVGKPAKAELVLLAKAPFHVNDKYPYKFKLKEAAGLTFPAPVVGKDAAVLEKASVTMAVPFSATSAGKHTLAGQFAFSVCTDEKCLIEKRELALELTAK